MTAGSGWSGSSQTNPRESLSLPRRILPLLSASLWRLRAGIAVTLKFGVPGGSSKHREPLKSIFCDEPAN